MQYLEKALEKLEDWSRKVIELLFGPAMEPDYEPIPVPVKERVPRRYR